MRGLQNKAIFFIIYLAISYQLSAISCLAEDIKYPDFAGTFYPAERETLSCQLDSFIDKARPQEIKGDILAIISPHAGYDFSGPVAAYAYKLVKNKPYKTVIILAPSHRFYFKGVAVYPHGVFRTPLGDVEVDSEFCRKLLGADKNINPEERAFKNEHSLEVQLPFLQKALSAFKIVPVVMGDCDFATCKRFAGLIKEAIGKRKDILVVVSTDMYHGYDYQEAAIVDKLTLSSLQAMNPQELYRGLEDGRLQLCGKFPAVTALILARGLGHNTLRVLKYTDSAEVTGNKTKGTWTVGYASAVIDQLKSEAKMLNKVQKKKLLEIARESIKSYLKSAKKLELKEDDPILNKEMGAFVTLHEHKELRGCIGNIIGNQPLYLTVRDMAIESATRDPRFPAVGLSELKDIEIEISVLTPLKRIDSVDKIELGTHGVLVRQGFRSGVFLPQVATETGWSKEEFLSYLCAHKAGLKPDAWKDKATEIYIFSAEVFSEKDTLANE